MDISKQKTPIVVAIAVLWLVCVMLGSTGHFVWDMVLGVPLIGLHFMLGVARQGVVSRRFFRFCIIPWAVLMAATFILCGYYADLFKGVHKVLLKTVEIIRGFYFGEIEKTKTLLENIAMEIQFDFIVLRRIALSVLIIQKKQSKNALQE